MVAFGAFGVGAVVLVSIVVLLAHTTQQELEPDPVGGARIHARALSIRELYVNVVFSQLVVAGAFVLLIWLVDLPLATIGIGSDTGSLGPQVLVGGGVGAGIYLLDELGVVVLDQLGIEYAETLRQSLAPQDATGWAGLLFGVLPVIALVEELVFRGILIGGMAAAVALPLPVLVIASSVAFALGHGLQGAGGVLVTGILGVFLGAVFVVTESLLVVAVAHYVVNVLEFAIHEGVG